MKKKSKERIERDSMGQVAVPADAYYGASTRRAVLNFPVSNLRFSRRFLRALGLIKWGAALVNQELGLLEPRLAEAIAKAAPAPGALGDPDPRAHRLFLSKRSQGQIILIGFACHRTDA